MSPPSTMRVIVAEPLDPRALAWLGERCEVVQCPDPVSLREQLPRAQGLIVRTYTRVDGALLRDAPHLRVVARAGVGIDNIDVAACRARGVEVVYAPQANAPAVAELVFAMLLAVLRPWNKLDRAIGQSEWTRLRKESIAPRQLAGMTLGVWGLGRIGSRVAKIGAAFGMTVLYHDIAQIPPEDRGTAEAVGVDELLARSEALSLHVDGAAGNRHLVGPAELRKVRGDVILINTSRGCVVDAVALAAFLKSNPAALALLDVHDPEPIAPDSPLLTLPNARLLPHLGAATAPAHAAMSGVVHDVWRVLSGEKPEFPAP